MILKSIFNLVRVLALCLVTVIVVAPVAGQSIEGVVRMLDGTPIPGANVIVVGTDIGNATNADGHYLLERVPADVLVLRVSSIGFFTVQQTLDLRGQTRVEQDFVLEEKVFESDEVVVSASRREQPALSVPVSVTILSAEQLERRNVIGLDDALRTVSGIQVLDNQINIRGSSGFAYNTGSRVLLMLDGMPLLTADSDGIPLEALPASEIQRLEILKGPGSALYGSGAIGGVVNVVTKDYPENPTFVVRSYAGSWEPVRHKIWRQGWQHGDEFRPFWGVGATYAAKTSARFGWWANATFRRDTGYRELSGRDVFHAFAKGTYRPSTAYKFDLLLGLMSRQQDDFIFWASARDVLSPGRVSFGETPEPGSSPNGAPDNYVNQLSLLPAFTHFVSSRFYYEVKGRVFGSLVQPLDDQTGKPKPLSEGTVGFRYGLEGQAHWIPTSTSQIILGASRDAITTQSSFFVTSDGDDLGGQPEVAVFTHIEHEITNSLQWVGGLRFDHYSIDASTSEQRVSPKLSLAYKWRPGHTFRIAWGHGFRVPSFAERFTDNRDYLPIVRNLELRPERSQSIELGLRGSIPFFGGLRWDASLFKNTYQGFIEPRLVIAEQAFQFINLEGARILGAEVQVAWESENERVRADVGYTFLDSEEDLTGEDLPFRARHQIVTSADVLVWGGFRTGFDFRYASEPQRVESDFARFITDAEIMNDTKVLDLRVSRQQGPFEASLLVKNALEYYYIERPALLGATRNYTLRLTYTR